MSLSRPLACLLSLLAAAPATLGFFQGTPVRCPAAAAPTAGQRPSSGAALRLSLFDSILGKPSFAEPCVMGDEAIMSPKAHGTSDIPVQSDLR